MNQITPRHLFALSFLVGVSLVGGGLYLANELHLAACPLCIIQRMLYLALAGVSLLGLSLKCRITQIAAALGSAMISGAGIYAAGYQVWLQRFAHDVSCTANEPWWESFVYWAGELVPRLFEASGLCSDPAWKFLSLSIAEWSLIAFIGLFAVALLALRKTLRKQ